MSAAKPSLKERLEKLLVEFGYTALVVYFTIFALTLVGFAAAIQLGVHVETTAGAASTWFAAWVATKLTQPIRIIATLVITPLVVRIVHRVKGSRGAHKPE